jgi:hypothetical protein
VSDESLARLTHEASNGDAAKVEASTAAQLLEATRTVSPVLGDLFLLAALPRTFDEQLLARLADKDLADPTLRVALDLLLRNPLVHERQSGSWTVHSSVRRSLLHLWRSGSVETFNLTDSLEKLAGIYQDRYLAARSAATSLELIHTLLMQVNEDGQVRYRSFNDTINEQLIRTASELIHTRLQLSAEAGWRTMVEKFGELEDDGKAALCQTLARGWKGDQSLVPAERATLHNAWGDYFGARAANAQQRWEQALSILDAIKDPESIDKFFATWCHGERARALRGLYRFPEAFKEIEAEIRIHDTYHVDDQNSWAPWLEKVGLHTQLWEPAEAQKAAQEGYKRAENYAGANAQIAARLSIVANALELGDRPLATRQLLRALWRARQYASEAESRDARSANLKVASSALTVLASDSLRLVQSLSEQVRQLALEQGADGRIETLLGQADALAQNGDHEGALRRLDLAREVAEKEVPARLWQVRLEQADLGAELARPGVTEDCVMLAGEPQALEDLGVRGRCLAIASEGSRALGAYRDALGYLEQAQDAWGEMRHENATALLRVMRADLLRRLGDFEGAERELGHVMEFSHPELQGRLLICRARLSRDRGDAGQGAELASSAMRVALDRGDRVTGISGGVLACECYDTAHDYESLERTLTDVTEQVRAQLRYLSYKSTATGELADEHAARAVRIMVAGVGPSSERRRSAREHLDEAVRLDGEVWWYHLELGLLQALGGRAGQARPHIQTAIALTSDGALRMAMEELVDEL